MKTEVLILVSMLSAVLILRIVFDFFKINRLSREVDKELLKSKRLRSLSLSSAEKDPPPEPPTEEERVDAAREIEWTRRKAFERRDRFNHLRKILSGEPKMKTPFGKIAKFPKEYKCNWVLSEKPPWLRTRLRLSFARKLFALGYRRAALGIAEPRDREPFSQEHNDLIDEIISSLEG